MNEHFYEFMSYDDDFAEWFKQEMKKEFSNKHIKIHVEELETFK